MKHQDIPKRSMQEIILALAKKWFGQSVKGSGIMLASPVIFVATVIGIVLITPFAFIAACILIPGKFVYGFAKKQVETSKVKA